MNRRTFLRSTVGCVVAGVSTPVAIPMLKAGDRIVFNYTGTPFANMLSPQMVKAASAYRMRIPVIPAFIGRSGKYEP